MAPHAVGFKMFMGSSTGKLLVTEESDMLRIGKAVNATGKVLSVHAEDEALIGTEAERATYRTMHTASLASPALREGLTERSAQRSAKHLRSLLAAPAVSLTDRDRLLAWDGGDQHHADQAVALAEEVVASGSTQVTGRDRVTCDDPGCPLRQAIVAQLAPRHAFIGKPLHGLGQFRLGSKAMQIVRRDTQQAAADCGP